MPPAQLHGPASNETIAVFGAGTSRNPVRLDRKGMGMVRGRALVAGLVVVVCGAVAPGALGFSVTPGWECIPITAQQPVLSGGTGNTPSCPAKTTPVLAPTYFSSAVGGKPTVIFSAVNVQVVSGSGSTYAAPNGEGNLVVGYDENPDGRTQTGSNDLILGINNGWTGYGELVVGASNVASGPYAAVFGVSDTASGKGSLAAGQSNRATGPESSVTGGKGNGAGTSWSSILGGSGHHVTHPCQSIPATNTC